EEIDRFKRESSALGQNARTVSRLLDELRAKGHLRDGVPLSNGARLQIRCSDSGQPAQPLSGNHAVDRRIAAVALQVPKETAGAPVILVTKDINLRIKADALGLEAEDYETDRVFLTDLYSGLCEKMVSHEKMTHFRANGELEIANGKVYFPNEYCTLTDE